MVHAVEAIHAKQLNDQGDGTVTVSIVNPTGITCQKPTRAAQVGDVYSVDPKGTIGARPAGTNGPWERARVVGATVVFAPAGAEGPAVLLPYVTAIPNVPPEVEFRTTVPAENPFSEVGQLRKGSGFG